MKLVIHAGAHKTATTSIQQWLKQSTRALAAAKIHYLEPALLNDSGIIEELHNVEPRERAKVSNRFLRLLSEQSGKSRTETILLSHESILSFSQMLPRAIDKGFYGSIENSASCINMLAEEFEVKLIFYTRRQDTFLASVYMEFIKRGNIHIDFKEYCNAVNYQNISWLNLIESMSALMDSVEITVKPFELIENGDIEFMREFLEAVGVRGGEKLIKTGFPRSNESISATALQLMQAVGPYLVARDRRSLGQYFRTRFPTSDYGKVDILSPELSQEIVGYFADENSKLFKQWMPAYLDMQY